MKLKLFCLSLLFVISAGTICSADDTHMGVEPAQLVTLRWNCTSASSCAFYKFNPDAPSEAFEIPERMVFVVTEFDWRYKDAGQVEFSNMLEFSLLRGKGIPVNSYAFTQSIGCGSQPLCAPSFGASGSEQMTTGFVVARGTELSPRIMLAFQSEVLNNQSSKLMVIVRGYFVEPSCGFYDLPPCIGR